MASAETTLTPPENEDTSRAQHPDMDGPVMDGTQHPDLRNSVCTCGPKIGYVRFGVESDVRDSPE